VATPTTPTALRHRRTLLRLPLAVAAALALPLGARAQAPSAELPPEVAQSLPQGQAQGAGRLRYLLWDVFDATLWTLEDFRGTHYFDHAFALELRYLRKLTGAALVESSLQEMRRAGNLDASKEPAWTAAMQSAFPDVQPGDRITGVHRPGAGARFYFNGRLRANVDDAAFARAFFGIWLSPSTSEPRLRSALLAGSVP